MLPRSLAHSIAPLLMIAACTGQQPPPSTPAPTATGVATSTAENTPTGARETVATNDSNESKWAGVLSGPQRTPEERARDVYRHPRETLEFFEVQEGMNVVELAASRGWYTAILAPLLGPKGSLTVTSADPNGPTDALGTKYAKALAERISSNQGAFGNVLIRVVDWNLTTASLGPDATADTLLTFRNCHGCVRDGVVDNVLSATKRVLKPGGVLGVVEHRAKPDGSVDPKVIGETGYVPEQMVIKAAEHAGFKLVSKSEINANPQDTKEHPKGVWTLPPSLALGDADREKYMRIGESDRMTLKFVKP